MNDMLTKEENEALLPIVVGVTGHRDLREQDIPRLTTLIRSELSALKEAYPHSPMVLLDSVAAGADMLCAELALELGYSLYCALPMPPESYSDDFSAEELPRFNALLQASADVFVVPPTEPAPSDITREYLYRQAGIYIARYSHVLLALWDGTPAKPDGCGTASAVSFMLEGAYKDADGLRFSAENDGAVIHIHTPRQSGGEDITPRVSLLEAAPNALSRRLGITDQFNADASAACPRDVDALAPSDVIAGAGNRAARLNKLYLLADSLSVKYQGKYIAALKWLSVSGTAMVLAFLLYDELETKLFLPLYGIIMLASAIALRLAKRGKCHERYLQYRVLAEALRVQFFLCAAGIWRNIGEAFTWTQKQDSTWVKEAVSALLLGAPAPSIVSTATVKRLWIDSQLAYHKRAAIRDRRKLNTNDRLAGLMLAASVVLFITVLILEYGFSQFMAQPLALEWSRGLTLSGLFKILLGSVSAVTLLLSSYYGKLSLNRKVTDHGDMAALYESARRQYENGLAEPERLFWELAREEIIENGNWYSYCRENAPSVNL